MSYVYTVARLRGMENHILDNGFFSRLMDSAGIDDALKALSETSYAQWLNQSGGFDKAIDSEILSTCEELSSFVPDKELLTIFRLPYDFHNVKVLLKGLFKVRGGEAEGRRYDLISKLGTINTEELTEAINTVLGSEEVFKGMQEVAQSKGMDYFSYQQIARKSLEL